MTGTAILVVCVYLLAGGVSVDLPDFSKSYKLQAVIRVPNAEIEEPITAYFDAANNRSRVDYYNGVQRTFQFTASTPEFPFGVNFKVVPITTQKVFNQISCFQLNGSESSPVKTTTVVPELTNYTFIGVQLLDDTMQTNVYRKIIVEGKKTNIYTLWTTPTNSAPVRYQKSGTDKYYIDFVSFMSPYAFQEEDFSIPDNLTCHPFHGAENLTADHHIQLNPVKEFTHDYDEHVHEHFEKFKVQHGKQYTSDEHETRKEVFRQNLRFIHSMNRAGLSYTLGVNHLADKTGQEIEQMKGFRYNNRVGGRKFSMDNMRIDDIPDQWDWRIMGAVTPVKNQFQCGSCWSFGTTGTIEGAYFLKTGDLVRLSQQELVDCSWGQGNHGCDGGEDFHAYQYIIQSGGLTTDGDYGPYLAIDGYCKIRNVSAIVQITNYTAVPEADLAALKVSIFNQGPISVSIDASQRSFNFYANGLYYEPHCKNGKDWLDHSVLAVGYGSLDGQDYWLIKNSWSTYWGNDGYALMAQKDNNCGVATAATFVDLL